MDISPQITAAHAKIFTKGPPNIIKPPSTTKLHPDQLDISFALAFIQAIVSSPYLILEFLFLCPFHATQPPNLNDQYDR